MIRNMGTTDRIVRGFIGVAALVAAIFVVGWSSTLGTIVGIGLLVVAAITLVTAAVGFCPAYLLFHISTNPTLHRTSKLEAKPEKKVPAHH